MKKALIGTELHLSKRFSNVWFNAVAYHQELREKFDFVVFDNGAEDGEAQDIKVRCDKMGFRFFVLPKNSRLHNAVDNIATIARENKYEFYGHFDIDCPPVFPNLVDLLFSELDKPGVAAVTDRDGAHFCAFKTKICSWMPAGYHPVYDGMKQTRFLDVAKMGAKDQAGRNWFDECRWIFQDCEEQGYGVKTLELPLLHPTCTSFNIPGSRRWGQVYPSETEWYKAKAAHESFWSNPVIRQFDIYP